MGINCPSGAERRLVLVREDLTFGYGGGHGFNCSSDSVLQLLVFNNMVSPPTIRIINTWRHEVCEAVILHLCCRRDERLWPRQRDDDSCIRDVLPEQHSSAY